MLTVLFVAFIPKLQLSYDFEKFFPQHDAELDFYLKHRAKFETDNDFVLIAIKPIGGVFNAGFLSKLDSLTHQLARVKNIESRISIVNYRLPILTPLGWNVSSNLDYTDTTQLPLDSIRLMQDQNVHGNLLSNDGSTATVILRNRPYISKKASDSLLHSLDKLVQQQQFDEVHFAGKIHGQYHYIRKMGEELTLFTCISLILLAVFLFFTFRTIWGIWVPILIVAVTILWTLGFIALVGEELNILCTILPTIIFVVGIADSVHILEKFVHEIRNGHTKLQALIIAYKHVGFATLLTAITNAIGFITLLVSDIEPIRKFGLFTALGILFAFLLTYLLLPAALLFLPTPKVTSVKHSDTFWHKVLPKLFVFVLNNKRKIVFTTLGICALATYGAFQIKINNYLLEDWGKNDPQRKEYTFFEDNFAGVRPFEMSVAVRGSQHSILDSTVLREMDKLENYLTKTYGIGAVASPVILVKTLNKAAHAGDNAHFCLPQNQEEWETIQAPLKKVVKNKKSRNFLSSDLKSCRISGRITDYGGYQFKFKNKKLDQFIAKNIDGQLLKIQQTGMPMLIDKNNENLSSDIGLELGLSLLLVAGLMGLLFQNFRIVIIALIPNLVPLLLIAGFMGATGIDLKISTSLIFSIAFGIAVDDTIHFMSNLRLELAKGKSPAYALKSTYLSTGKAITITNIILLSGFFSLILSSFASTFYLGLLVSLTLLIALVAELLLMPVLFLWLYRNPLRD